MLVLTRKPGEQIQIGDGIVITLLRVKGNTVRIGIEAPATTRIVRAELPRHEDPSVARDDEEAPNGRGIPDPDPSTRRADATHPPVRPTAPLPSSKGAPARGEAVDAGPRSADGVGLPPLSAWRRRSEGRTGRPGPSVGVTASRSI